MKAFAFVLLILGVTVALWVLICGGYINGSPIPDVGKAKDLHPFMTGLVLPLLTLGSTLLVIENLRTTTQQNFSTNFLKLIDLHNKLVESINTTVDKISTEAEPSKGRAFFDDLAYRIANDFYCTKLIDYNPVADKLPVNSDLQELVSGKEGAELLVVIYDYYFQINQSDLGHYFRNLYHIIRYAERANVTDKIKIEHLKILRAQLSNYEILILGYNGMHEYGAKFFPLIEKYKFLKNLNNEKTLCASRTKRIVDFEILVKAYAHLR